MKKRALTDRPITGPFHEGHCRGKTYGTGSGRTKKLAEQRAAREALRLVKKKQG